MLRRTILGLLVFWLFYATGALAADTQQVVATCGTPTGLSYPIPGLGSVTINTNGQLCGSVTSTPIPGGGTAITGNATGSTGAVVGTLAGVAGKTTYICGFSVSGTGGTANIGPITVAGLVGSSQVYQLSNNVASTATNFSQSFNPCIPASAANTAITVTTTADGTATAVDVNSYGYQL